MATARPRPQVMRLSEAAASRIKELMVKAERPIAAVKVGVKNGGCAGMEYTMEYVEQIGATDEVVEDKGVKLVVDPKAVMVLLVTEMDWKIGKLSSQFIFNNPSRPRPAAAANPCC
jgi:iron-sulfur cluster assembly protein